MRKRIIKLSMVVALVVLLVAWLIPVSSLMADEVKAVQQSYKFNVGACAFEGTEIFRFQGSAKASNTDGAYFRLRNTNGTIINLGWLEPGESFGYDDCSEDGPTTTIVEGTWIKEYSLDNDSWGGAGGTTGTNKSKIGVEGGHGYCDCAAAPGGLVVFKYSGDQPLAGAVFDVVDGEGFAAKITSGVDGYASITGLEPGTYYVREVIAPEGYDIDPNQYTVLVDEGGTGRVDIENDPLPTPTPTPPAEGTGEVEVLGVSEELPYTGYSWMYYAIGFSVIALAGGLTLVLRTARRKNEA